jgi:hypothetical protein
LWSDEDNIKYIIDNNSVVWGGFFKIWTVEELNKYENIIKFIKKILLYAGIFCIYIIVIEYVFSYYIKPVKKSIMLRQPAEIQKLEYSTFLNISQRLESGNFIYPYLVGLIEGDGWFSVSKKGKYIMFELGIEFSIRDIQLIYKIKDLLGVGTVYFRNKKKTPTPELVPNNFYILTESKWEPKLLNKRSNVIFTIRDKSHLKEIIIPIFDKYPFLTNKQYDYIRFRTALFSNIIYSKDLLPYVRSEIPINSVESVLNTPYFSPWLIGFIEAESSFSIYKPINDSSFVASFEITQTNAKIILLAIKEFLSLTQNVRKDITNNFRIKVSNIRGIENVIKFMKRGPLKLQGYKKLQYNIWLNKLRKIPRYTKKINIPENY